MVPGALGLRLPQAHAASAVSYCGSDEWGQLRRDCLFCYDLELPWGFTPQAVDGEVSLES